MEDPAQWQTPAAIAVVAITAVLFTVRLVKKIRSQPSKKGACGEGCGCSTAGKPDFLTKSQPSPAPTPTPKP